MEIKFFVRFIIMLLMAGGISSCASHVLKYEKADTLKKIDEYDQQVQIVPADQKVETPVAAAEVVQAVKVKKHKKKTQTVEKTEAPVVDNRHWPELESSNGFVGRRPLQDPFRIGEKIRLKVKVVGLTAGEAVLEVLPFAQVNGRKSYQFGLEARTSSIFASIYSMDDRVTSMVDFETLTPSVFTLQVKEAKELREARALFDQKAKTATYWEKKVTDDKGEQQKKIQWDILEYSQNVYSAAFYLRLFHWDVGTENAFRVADDNQNLIFKAKGIRKEVLHTEIGDFNTIVIKPEIQLEGVAKPVGDIYFWLSDDDRKYVLRIESQLKIGTLNSEVVELVPGHD